MQRWTRAVVAGALLLLLVPTGPGAGAQSSSPPVNIVAAVDEPLGNAAMPISAIWREPRQRRRWTMQLLPGVDLSAWRIVLNVRPERGSATTVTVRAPNGVATATMSEITPDGPVARGSTAAFVESGLLVVELPEELANPSSIEVIASQGGGTRVSMAPFSPAALLDTPNEGLRSPSLSTATGPTDVEAAHPPLPEGPALLRLDDGIQIDVLDAPPTEVEGRPVAAVRDAVAVRAGPSPDHAVSLRLVVGPDAVTAETTDGTPLTQSGAIWSVPLEANGDLTVRSATIAFDQLSLLAGTPVGNYSRFGVTRIVGLEGGGRITADGVDAVHSALPLARPGGTGIVTTIEPEAADRRWVLGLVALGVLAVVAVAIPTVKYRLEARRARRVRHGR